MGTFEDLARARAGGGGGASTAGGSFAQLARQRSGGGVVPSPPSAAPKKKHPWWETVATDVLDPGPVSGDLIAKYAPNKYLREAGRIESVLTGAPGQVARHPGRTTSQALGSLTGIPSMGAALGHVWMTEYRKKGGGEHGSLHADLAVLKTLATATAKDYEKRYGKNYKAEAGKNPFSNWMDLLTVVGGASRAVALAGAARRLGESELAITPSRLWQESSRPGILTEGQARTRRIVYQPPDSEKAGVTMLPYSRSPLRRGMQKMLDQISEQHPHLPGFGAKSRLTRGDSQALQRTVERLLGSVDGAESLNKIGDAGRSRLFYGGQINDHSTEALQELRNALHAELTTHKPDAPVDQGALEADLQKADAAHRAALNEQGHHADIWNGPAASPEASPEIAAARNAEQERAREAAVALQPKVDAAKAELVRARKAVVEAGGKVELVVGGVHVDWTDAGRVGKGLSDFLWEAKQAGFGPQMLDRLDKAIAYKPDTHYWKAEQAMRDATDLVQSVMADQNGFSNIENDMTRAADHVKALEDAGASPEAIQAAHDHVDNLAALKDQKAADLQEMFGSRLNRLSDWYHANRYTNSAVRTARLKELEAHPNFGPEKARAVVALTDRLANASGDSPAWWAKNIGMPGHEPGQQFLARAAEAFYQQAPTSTAAGVRNVMEDTLGMATAGGERTSVYYSGFQRWLADPKTPPRMPVEQLQATLRKGLKPLDYENSGLDLYFTQIPEGTMVNKEDLLNHVAIPLNAYDLEEIHLVNDPSLPRELQTTWDRYGGKYMSRNPAPGEYHEIVMKLPGKPQGRGIFGNLHGTGEWDHWQQNDVVFHIRYHVFEEGGVRKLLVEEIQSDWEKLWRTQKREHGYMPGDIPPLPPDAHGFLDYAQQRIEQLREAQDQLPDLNSAEWHALEAEVTQIQDEAQQLELIHPSPLGPNYHRAAVRRVMREAGEQDVHQVIVTDPRVQAVRNMRQHELLTMWKHSDPPGRGIQSPEELSHWFTYNQDAEGFANWQKLYGKDHPDVARKEYGLTPVTSEAAYQGRYSTQGGTFSPHGNMPGTVIEMTPEAKAQALTPSPLYQRQPEWGALPKGAIELLADGNRVIHMFQTADVSTWIHELAHTALFDLSDADRAVVEAHYGGGLAVDAWKESMHENFARDFEHYMREGVAPSQPLQKVFSQISQWMKAIYHGVKAQNDVPPEVSAVFDRMFTHPSNTPDIFIPHRVTKADLGGTRTSRGIPRASREIGDQVKSRIPLFAKNRLTLLRSGMLDDDPRHLFEHVNRVVMMARANQLRDMVLHMSRPLEPGEYPNFDTQYVVKRAGSGVDKPTFDALENAEDPTAVRATIKDFVDSQIATNDVQFKKWLENRDPNEQLYVVNKPMVDSLFENVTGSTPGATTGPKTGIGHAFDVVQDTARGMLLYGNPGFYIANMVGNAWMSAFADPRSLRYLKWGMQNAVKAATGSDSADPLFGKISVEMGRGPTAGQLSSSQSFLGGGSRGTRAVDRYEHALHWWGARSGRVIDDSFRVGAWRQVARKYGYKTAEQQSALIDAAAGERKMLHKTESQARQDLQGIRDEAENLMLDFDSMTPFEKKYLMRSVFLYPFLRASMKYPAMYAGERPIVAGLTGTAGTIGNEIADQQFGPRDPNLPLWAQGYARLGGGQYLNIGSVSPIAPALGVVESLLNIGRPAQIGINRPLSYINPVPQLLYELMRSQNKYGRDTPAQQILRQDLPVPGYIAQGAGLRKPSSQYSGQSEWDAILRSLRVYPFGMTSGG